MKRTRLLWAAAMAVATAVVLAGFTGAGALRPAGTALSALEPAQVELPELPELPAAATEAALQVVVRDEGGRAGALQVRSEDGALLFEAVPGETGSYGLELPPGRYTLVSEDGQVLSFTLRPNASVGDAAGSGWSDGEILHLDGTRRCMLRLLRTAPSAVVYTLTGPDCEESRALGGAATSALFPGLLPGAYQLRGSDGSLRELELDTRQAEWVVGLD